MAVVKKSGHVEVVVAAPLDAVWRVVSDVTRTGEWSHECCEVKWLDGATVAAPGVRFRGRNRAGPWRWGRTCTVVTIVESRSITWQSLSTPLFPDSTVWRIELEPVGEGTRIVQEFQIVRLPRLLEHFYAAIIPGHQDRSEKLAADLQRIGDVARG